MFFAEILVDGTFCFGLKVMESVSGKRMTLRNDVILKLLVHCLPKENEPDMVFDLQMKIN